MHDRFYGKEKTRKCRIVWWPEARAHTWRSYRRPGASTVAGTQTSSSADLALRLLEETMDQVVGSILKIPTAPNSGESAVRRWRREHAVREAEIADRDRPPNCIISLR
jgi:hypothetical protein